MNAIVMPSLPVISSEKRVSYKTAQVSITNQSFSTNTTNQYFTMDATLSSPISNVCRYFVYFDRGSVIITRDDRSNLAKYGTQCSITQNDTQIATTNTYYAIGTYGFRAGQVTTINQSATSLLTLNGCTIRGSFTNGGSGKIEGSVSCVLTMVFEILE